MVKIPTIFMHHILVFCWMFNTEPELLHNSSQFIWIKICLLKYFSTLENIKNLNIDHCNPHYSHVLNLFSHSAVRLRESLLLNVWPLIKWRLFSCSLYIPCPTTACLTFILLTWLTFLHPCPRPQLVIVLIRSSEGRAPLLVFCWFPGN